MTLSAILTDCEAKGIRLNATRAGMLEIDGPEEALTPGTIAQLKAFKAELIDVLERIEERAAIMEYDGGLDRQEAERLARMQELRNL